MVDNKVEKTLNFTTEAHYLHGKQEEEIRNLQERLKISKVEVEK